MLNDWLDREYDNRAKVPEHGAIMAGWKADAEAFRAAHPHAEIGLSYGASARQQMDIFWPEAHRRPPIAMFIHGGYWQALDKTWFSHLARGFLAHSVALALPSYDLCPDVSLAALTEQLRDAAAFVMRRHACDLYVTGHSAGGHLAAMLLATDWPPRGSEHRVYGGLAVSGLFDLEPLLETKVNTALGLDRETARQLSPTRMPAPMAMLRAFVGALEGAEFTRQSREIAAAWTGEWGLIEGANHFTAVAPLAMPDSPMMRRIRDDIANRPRAQT